MKITILNGSPKGAVSVTMQYVNYLVKKLPGIDFKVFHISQQIKGIEKNTEKFNEIISCVELSDGIIWDFPIYFFMAPSQVKRFIELVIERNAGGAFMGKYATVISSSMHFYDHSAHNYINGICDDLGMKYVDGFSAEMQDLLKPENREQLEKWGKLFIRHIEEKIPVPRKFKPIIHSVPEFIPGDVEETEKTGKYKILLSTDAEENDTNLLRMIDTFVKISPNPVEVVNIRDLRIKGGCLGCCKCCDRGECVYKDDYMQFYEEKFLKADIAVTAASIKDRYLSSFTKMFYDRQFYNGHRPVTQGRQIGYIISGPLGQLENLREILNAMVEVGRTSCAGIVTDESEDSGQTVSLLKALSDNLVYMKENQIIKPWTYLGKGGHLIFRDLVYSGRSFLKADYEYYKKEGLLDYPNMDLGKDVQTTLFSLMMSIPQIREKAYSHTKENMIKPFGKILAEA